LLHFPKIHSFLTLSLQTDTISLFFSCICIFQIFEWWYFKKYGTSFIEQVSLNHISPLLGGTEGQQNDNNNSNTNTNSNNTTNTQQNQQTQQSMPG
jgi:hypothetical protein